MKGDLNEGSTNEKGSTAKLATARELFPQLGRGEARAGDRGELRFRTGPPAGAAADGGLAGTGRGRCSSPTVLLLTAVSCWPKQMEVRGPGHRAGFREQGRGGWSAEEAGVEDTPATEAALWSLRGGLGPPRAHCEEGV